MRAVLYRIADDGLQTIGFIHVIDPNGKIVYKCKTLEKSYKQNRREISSIPKGEYNLQKRWSPRFGEHYHVLNVKDRTLILIHAFNYETQSKGCIGVGDNLKDINNDGRLDLTNSRKTLKELVNFKLNKITISDL